MSTAWDESKIRRGQPGNAGQFAVKSNSAPAASLTREDGLADRYARERAETEAILSSYAESGVLRSESRGGKTDYVNSFTLGRDRDGSRVSLFFMATIPDTDRLERSAEDPRVFVGPPITTSFGVYVTKKRHTTRQPGRYRQLAEVTSPAKGISQEDMQWLAEFAEKNNHNHLRNGTKVQEEAANRLVPKPERGFSMDTEYIARVLQAREGLGIHLGHEYGSQFLVSSVPPKGIERALGIFAQAQRSPKV